MKRYFDPLLWLLIALAGCAQGPGQHDGTKPTPATGSIIADAAEQSLRDYEHRMSDVAGNVATRITSGELKSHADVFAAFQSDSKAARETAFKPYEQAVTDTLKPGDTSQTFDQAKAAKAFSDVAAGFKRRAAK